jgi:hypothetical protein
MKYREININFDDVKTQKDAVKWHLGENGNITSWVAIKEYGATRLSAIIFNLRKEGYNIISDPQKQTNRFGRSVVIAKYKYVAPVYQGEQTQINF